MASSNGWTALFGAAGMGHADVARELIKAGADVNEKTKLGSTALMCAIHKGHSDIVKLLKEAGAYR